jgi:hypothetical protein
MNGNDEYDQPKGRALRIERRTFVHGDGTPMNSRKAPAHAGHR